MAPPSEKLCARCGRDPAARGYKYCSPCIALVYEEMCASGYLQPLPPSSRELPNRELAARRRWQEGGTQAWSDAVRFLEDGLYEDAS